VPSVGEQREPLTASGPFTVRPWAHGHPGAVIDQYGHQVLSTATVAETMKLIAGLQATLPPAAPVNLTPPIITVRP
jgi:hypothetical protein